MATPAKKRRASHEVKATVAPGTVLCLNYHDSSRGKGGSGAPQNSNKFQQFPINPTISNKIDGPANGGLEWLFTASVGT